MYVNIFKYTVTVQLVNLLELVYLFDRKLNNKEPYSLQIVLYFLISQPVPPIVLRSRTVKKELEETKSLKHKLEAKEADIKVICIL
jgi:hypothetical protein